MTRLPASVRYSLLLFAPLVVLLLIPVPCLGSECLLLTAIHLSDPSSIDPRGLAGFCAWGLGPLPAAAVVFALGLVGYWLTSATRFQRIGRLAVWAMFTLTALSVAWYGIILVTSIGASETPPMKFLGITALIALAVVVLGQPLVLLWLSLVDRFRTASRPSGRGRPRPQIEDPRP